MALLKSLLLLGATAVFATPIAPREVAPREVVTVTVEVAPAAPTETAWNAGAVDRWTIHESCNRTERAQLERAFDETQLLVEHARDHILRWGNSSKIYQKYFGNASTGTPIGWFDKVARGDKAGILFRCDDIDGNCKNPNWGGHWRGANATQETVICPLSYSTRKPLEGVCGFGYNVANWPTNFYFASDLLHRLFHIPSVGEGIVEHYADEYDLVLDLAKTHPEETVINTDTLQYFALEAYAYDIAVPGDGCAGKFVAPSSSGASSVTSPTPTPTPSATQAATATADAAAECHTHADGVVHCV